MGKEGVLVLVTVLLLLVPLVSAGGEDVITNLAIPQGAACNANLQDSFDMGISIITENFPNKYFAVDDASLCTFARNGDTILDYGIETKVASVIGYPDPEMHFTLTGFGFNSKGNQFMGDFHNAASVDSYDENSAEYIRCKATQGANCNMMIHSAEACGEFAVFSLDRLTNSISAIEDYNTFDVGDTRCDGMARTVQGGSVDGTFTLPLKWSCESYEIRFTEQASWDWLNSQYSLNVNYPLDCLGDTCLFDSRGSANDFFNLVLTLDTDDNTLQHIYTEIRDWSSMSGGLGYELYCVNPQLDGDRDFDSCTGMEGDWNDIVNESFPGYGCCGDDPEDLGEFYTVGQEYYFCTEEDDGSGTLVPTWVPVTSDDCTVDFLNRYGFDVTEFPTEMCVGEVLRPNHPDGPEYLARMYSWQIAQGTCREFDVKGHKYLDVKPTGNAAEQTTCTVTGPEICNDNIDNNCNNLQDCADPACVADAACTGGGGGGGACNPGASCVKDLDCNTGTCDFVVEFGENTCWRQTYNTCTGTTSVPSQDTINPRTCTNDFSCGTVPPQAITCAGGSNGWIQTTYTCQPAISNEGGACNCGVALAASEPEKPIWEEGVTGFTTATHPSFESFAGSCTCANNVIQYDNCVNAEPACQNPCTGPGCCECRGTGPDDPDGPPTPDNETGEGDNTPHFTYWAECIPPGEQRLNKIDDSHVGGLNFTTTTGEVTCYDAGGPNIYYCAQIPDPQGNFNSVSWIYDLDSKEYTQACADYGFVFTGDYCCGEADDMMRGYNESYNDPQGNGACYKGLYQPKDQFFAPYENRSIEVNSVLVVNGTFWGCRLAGTPWGYDLMTLTSDAPNPGQFGDSGAPLITNHDYDRCTYAGDEDKYYCRPEGNWTLRNGQDKDWQKDTHSSWILDINETAEGCCGEFQCWDGMKCVANQNETYTPEGAGAPYHETYRCIVGEWIEQELKKNPDGSREGYCPRESMCFLTSGGCVEWEEWQDDDYCEDGAWTTRTRKVADEMIKITNRMGGEFRLLCDDKQKSLIDPRSNTGQSKKYCALWIRNEVVLGTAIGTDMERDGLERYIPELKQEHEENYQGGFSSTCSENDFNFEDRCINADRLYGYYDADSQIILLESDGGIVRPSFFAGLWQSIWGLLTNTEHIAVLTDFDKLFIAKDGNKQVTAISEKVRGVDGTEDEYITLEYRGVSMDLDTLENSILAEEIIRVNQYTLVVKNPASSSSGEELWDLLSGRTRI